MFPHHRICVVYHNLNYDTYYYKFVSGTYSKYNVGDINSYNHEIILVIDRNEVQPIIEKHYFSIIHMVLTPIIKFLKLILKFLQKINTN